jgi:hypothetical protein
MLPAHTYGDPVALLDHLWEADRVPYRDKGEEQQLGRETRDALAWCICTTLGCEVCAARGTVHAGRIEHHHTATKHMYFSDYRHNIKQHKRRERMLLLATELLLRMRRLCKACHEAQHHLVPRSVQRGKRKQTYHAHTLTPSQPVHVTSFIP